MDIYLGIDGTGPSNDDEYRIEFTDSFVRRFHHNWHTTAAKYLRGPSLLGGETMNLVEAGMQWLDAEFTALERNRTPFRIFLSGYSRGGAAVTEVAFRLNRQGRRVHCMMLFDAVDRSNLANVDIVPANVHSCYHAVRDPKAGSREFFGNCARRAAPGVSYTEKLFYGTHGAMGGTPWTLAGSTGKIHEMTDRQRAAAIAAGRAAIPTLLRPVLGPGVVTAVNEQTYTNVTLAQEQAAATAVWEWMSGNLRTARAAGAMGPPVPAR